MRNYKTIKITFNNGHTETWRADRGQWDDYGYDGAAFIIRKKGRWVGIYNMNHVASVVVK